MTNYCAFSHDKRCIKRADYELTRIQLEDADALCHGNWIEIQLQQDYIDLLENLLKQHGIPLPPERY